MIIAARLGAFLAGPSIAASHLSTRALTEVVFGNISATRTQAKGYQAAGDSRHLPYPE